MRGHERKDFESRQNSFMPKQDYHGVWKEDWIKQGLQKIGGKENETLYPVDSIVYIVSWLLVAILEPLNSIN